MGFKLASFSLPVCLKSSVLIASLGKKAARKSVEVEEEEDNELPDLEEEGEKENEDLGNDGGSPVSKPKKKRKRRNEEDASSDQTNDKKNKTDDQGTGALRTLSTCLCHFFYSSHVFIFNQMNPAYLKTLKLHFLRVMQILIRKEFIFFGLFVFLWLQLAVKFSIFS